MKNSIKILLFLAVLSLSACLKDNSTFIDPNIAISQQFSRDSILMSKYIIDNDIDTSGVRYGVLYQILEPGTGDFVYTSNSQVTVKYEGKLLNGTVFDKTDDTARTFTLGTLIPGWQIGIPLIQKGGKIRLIVPSYYGYGTSANGIIPANSVLDFIIELTEVK